MYQQDPVKIPYAFFLVPSSMTVTKLWECGRNMALTVVLSPQ